MYGRGVTLRVAISPRSATQGGGGIFLGSYEWAVDVNNVRNDVMTS